MKDQTDVKILPEDRIRLTQDQKNLIQLAFAKQLPPEDAEFIEKVQRNIKKSESKLDSFAELSGYYTAKYGLDFGMVYLVQLQVGKKNIKKPLNLSRN